MKANQEVFIGSKVKRVGLQRYLLTKIALESDKVETRDVFALFANQLWLERKSSSDSEFSEKFRNTLEVVSSILKEINFGRGLSSKALSRIASKVKTRIPDFLYPPRNFKQMKSKFAGSYTLKSLKPTGTPLKNLPPKRFIGKGYGDKGTAKKPNIDASHSWQDVASVVANKERRTQGILDEVRNAKTFEELEKAFWKGIEESKRK